MSNASLAYLGVVARPYGLAATSALLARRTRSGRSGSSRDARPALFAR